MIKEHTVDLPSWASALISICQSLAVEANTAFVIMHDLGPEDSQNWSNTLAEIAMQRGQTIGIDVEFA